MARYAKFFSVGAGGGGTNNLQLPIGTILDTTLRQVQDGTGTGSPLYLSTRRVGITSDSSVTTQVSSVIQATTTNANLVIAPNGTGALVASIPDGTATGGNARGANAVDLQMKRNTADQVAGPGEYAVISGGTANRNKGPYGFIGGGIGNAIDIGGAGSNYTSNVITGGTVNLIKELSRSSVICGGWENTINSAENSVIGGGRSNNAFNYISHATIGGGQGNSVSSNHSTISGGQSNTASTGTHATVVGGQSNVSSGFHSITGGSGCTASAEQSVSLGLSTISSGQAAISLGYGNNATNFASIALSDSSLSYLKSQVSIASGTFSGFPNQRGESQQSLLTAYKLATLNTAATTVLSLNGTGVTNLIIPNGTNRMWNVQVRWVAVVTDITGTATGVTVGDTKTSTDLLAVAKRGGTTTVSAHTSAGTHAIETIAGSLTAANIAYTAGASKEMAITFTGPTFAGGGSVTMRVVAAISLTEVAY